LCFEDGLERNTADGERTTVQDENSAVLEATSSGAYVIRDGLSHARAKGVKKELAALSIYVAMAGCIGRVRNDIDSINSELTGPYSVLKVTDAKTYVADVCVANSSREDLVASQVVHQQLSRGHDAIIVNLYARDGRRQQAIWRPGTGTQLHPLDANAGHPCG
jgi:hypothetical protein